MGDENQYIVAELGTDGHVLPPQASTGQTSSPPDERFDEGNSIDLSPVKMNRDGATNDFTAGSSGISGHWSGMSEELEDTFHYRHPAKLTT